MKIKTILIIIMMLIGAAIFPTTSADLEEDISAAIEIGVDWLVAQQNIDGSWPGYYSSIATTALAVLKLEERAYELGYDSPFDEAYPFYQNVIHGLDFLFSETKMHTIAINIQDHTGGASGSMDNPDTNGNGIGVYSFEGYSTYETGLVLSAIVASGTPDRTVVVSGSAVDGWTYKNVVQDMVDWLSWGQADLGVGEGGWHYSALNNAAGGGYGPDNSNTGYAVLGLAYAQDFECTVPEWVKIELNAYINNVQDPVNGDTNDGGSWYSYVGDAIGVNILKTGNLIFEMAFVGDDYTTSTRMQDAVEYLERHWDDNAGANAPPGWNGTTYVQYQAAFCAMKGLAYAGIETFDSINWFEDFALEILSEQILTVGPDYGSWQYSSGRGVPIIITEWALLILEKSAPVTPNIVGIEKYYTHTNVNFNPWHWEYETLFTEDFSPCDLLGWTVDPDNLDNWECSFSDYAGGELYEARFDWAPLWGEVDDSWLESPVINTVGFDMVNVSFNQSVDWWAEAFILGVQASTDGSTWTSVYSQLYSGNSGPERITFTLPDAFIDSPTTQLRFYFFGDNYNIDFWYIDDVEVVGRFVVMDPAELGTTLNNIHMVINKNKVKSHNPGQFYSVINITGPVKEFLFRDDFDVEFNVHPKKIGTGGCQVLLLDPDGYATVITNSPWVNITKIDNNNNYVEIEFNFSEPMPSGYTLKIYIKYQTSYKQKPYGAGDGGLADDEFWNIARYWDYEDEPWTLETEEVILPITGVPT